MATTYRIAYVYVKDIFAGTLKETDEGYSFIYDKDYIDNESSTDVSLTLPKTKKEYVSKTLFPFFDGLIPEGWLLYIVTKNWKINPNDRFGLLLKSCNDCIGKVSIKEEKL